MGTITVDRPGGMQTIEDPAKIPDNRSVLSHNSLSREGMARQIGGFSAWNDTEIPSYAPGQAATQTGASTFTVVGDQTAVFVAGLAIRIEDSVTGFDYGTIDSSVFGAATTVTVSGVTLAATLTTAWAATNDPIKLVRDTTFADQAVVTSHVLAARGVDLWKVPESGDPTAIHTFTTANGKPSLAWFDVYEIFSNGGIGATDTIQVWDGTVADGAAAQLVGPGNLLSSFPTIAAAANPLEDLRPKILLTAGKGPAAGSPTSGAVSPDPYLFALDYVDMHGGGAGVPTYHRNALAYVNLTQGLASPPTTWDYAVVGGGKEGDNNYVVGGVIWGAHLFIWRAFGDIYVFKYVVDPEFFGNAAAGFVPQHVPFFEAPLGQKGIIKTPGPLLFPTKSGFWAMSDPDSPKPVKASRVIEGHGGLWERINKSTDMCFCSTYDPIQRVAMWAVALDAHTGPSHVLALELPDDEAQLNDFRQYHWHLWDWRGESFTYSNAQEKLFLASSLHGFVYEADDTLLRVGDADTVSGTLDSAAAGTIGDSTASFTDAQIGRMVIVADDDNDYLEAGWIAAVPSGTSLTMAEDFAAVPPIGATYEIGALRWRWTSKRFKPASGVQFFRALLAQVQALGSVAPRVRIYRDNDPDPIIYDYAVVGGVSLLEFVLGESALSDGATGDASDLEVNIDLDADRLQFSLSSYGSDRRIALVLAEIEWTQDSLELSR